MEKNHWPGVLLGLGAVILVIIAAASFYNRVGLKTSSEILEAIPTENLQPAEPRKTPGNMSALFSDQAWVWFEGWQGLDYQISYLPDQLEIISLVSFDGNKVVLKDKKTGNASLLSFVYNGAIGAPNVDEFWSILGQRYCPDCRRTKSLPEMDGIALFINPNRSDKYAYLVRPLPTNFAVLKTENPINPEINPAVTAFAGLSAKLAAPKRQGEPEQYKELWAYFIPVSSTVPTCGERDLVSEKRFYFGGTKEVGRVALEQLFSGPSDGVKLRTEIPDGSWFNSLRIENGTAYLDLNQASQSGGGSCSMSLRTAQIIKTLKQFPTVARVVLSVNGETQNIFQP